MQKIFISDEAYDEFKTFLDENNIEKYNIRINHAGNGCGGPVFNISVEETDDVDTVEKVKDINFIFKDELIDEFGGFTLLSTAENDGRGLSLKPLIESEGGCSSCGGGCH
jgi:HesB-like selenoprotein